MQNLIPNMTESQLIPRTGDSTHVPTQSYPCRLQFTMLKTLSAGMRHRGACLTRTWCCQACWTNKSLYAVVWSKTPNQLSQNHQQLMISLNSNTNQIRFLAGLCLDPLRELEDIQDPLAWWRGGIGKGMERQEGRWTERGSAGRGWANSVPPPFENVP